MKSLVVFISQEPKAESCEGALETRCDESVLSVSHNKKSLQN